MSAIHPKIRARIVANMRAAAERAVDIEATEEKTLEHHAQFNRLQEMLGETDAEQEENLFEELAKELEIA